MKVNCTAAGLVLGLLFPSGSRAEVASLQPSADTSIFQKFPTNSFGTSTDVPVGTTRDGNNGRALLKFDLSQIPQNAVITNVTLQIQVVNQPFGAVASTFGLHRMLKAWNEGVGGTQLGTGATTGDTTWSNRFYPDTDWGAPGGAAQTDFAAATNGEVLVAGPATYIFQSTAAMVADVRFWVTNGNSNFGWIMISEGEGTPFTARRVALREDQVNAPILTVSYSVSGTQAQQPQISNVSQGNNQIHFSFNAEANRTYAVEFRSAVDIGNWLTLSNIPAQPNPTTIPVSDAVTNGVRFYRIRTP